MINKPGYKKTRLGWIPDNWSLIAICELTDRVQNPVEVKDDHEYQEIGIRSHGKGLFIKEKITGKALGDKRVFWITPDCFIVNIVFAWEQAVAKTTNKEVGMIASHRFPMYKTKPDRLDLDYLLFFFNTTLGKQLLELASPGGAGRNKTLGQQEFAKLMIPIPPIKIQKRIVSILLTWDKTIELTNCQIEAKKEQKKELMQSLLTGKIRIEGFKDTWEDCNFPDIFSFVSTYAFSRKNLSYDEGNQVFNIHYGDIYANFKGNFIDFERNKIPRLIPIIKVTSSEHFLKDGDLIMADVSEDYEGVGECMEVRNLNGRKALGGLHTFVIRDKKGSTIPTFRTYLFNNTVVRNQLRKIATGSSVHGISKKNLANISLPIPPIEEQKAIVNILINADNEVELLKSKLEILKLQKKGLMQQLLTGKTIVV